MKIYAINGSPRKKWNTAKMLEHFLAGVSSISNDIEVETINLFDLTYTGCRSCFLCKLKNGKSYGKCGYKDELQGILEEVTQADGIAFGSPIYFSDITGQLRGFIERLFFPYHSFVKGENSIAPHKIYTAMIYTMNLNKDEVILYKYPENLRATENLMEYTLYEKPEIIYAYNTYQFDDYNKYMASYWDEEEKAEYRRTQFPIDCRTAFEAGQRMANKILSQQSTK